MHLTPFLRNDLLVIMQGIMKYLGSQSIVLNIARFLKIVHNPSQCSGFLKVCIWILYGNEMCARS